MKSHELIKFSKNFYKVPCYMRDINYKSHKLDNYLKHDDLQDRYTRSSANRMATLLPGNPFHTFSVITSKINHFLPPIVVENSFIFSAPSSKYPISLTTKYQRKGSIKT